ncbi:MAG: hypothetical protein ACOYK9_03685 [Chlamydiia bacterium]
MFSNLLLTITYDGTDFFGWDCQQNRSIKRVLLEALSPFFLKFRLSVASRTDRGVHAKDQKVLIQADEAICLPDNWLETINALLPEDIRILNCKPVQPDFHPSTDAKLKEYRYYFHTVTDELQLERFSLMHNNKFKLDSIEEALPLFLGKKNFRCFEDRSPKRRSDPTCSIHEIGFHPITEGRFFLKIIGDRFLYHMCRKIAGTLLYIGYGKIELKQLSKGIENLLPTDVGPTLPPNGLILQEVLYDRNDPFPV